MPLVLAIKRQVSSNKMVNVWMSSWDWENISVEWVPTHEQRADEYTRGKIFKTKGNLQAPEGPKRKTTNVFVKQRACFNI